MTFVQTKHKEEMLGLQKIIEKSLLFRKSTFSTPSPNPNTSNNISALLDLPSKTTKRWNQIDLGKFDPHLNRIYGKSQIVSVCKDVYYRNVVLFVQHLQRLLTFKGAAFVKTNIDMFLCDFALEWYTFKLNNFDRNILNNNSGVKSWINTLSHCFKVPTSVALNPLTNETYFLNNTCSQQSSAYYICTIM